jgi:hypothetical protein
MRLDAAAALTAIAVLVGYTGFFRRDVEVSKVAQNRIQEGDLASSVKGEEAKLSKWSVGFTEDALKYGVNERIIYPIHSIPFNADEVPLKDATFVGWDRGKVIEISKENSIYSKEYSSCVAVLARGYKEKSEIPTHAALHHVFANPESLAGTLEELVKQVGTGEVEVFISGGMKQTKHYRELIQEIIRSSETKNCKITVVDDTFGISDIGQPYKRSGDHYYPMSVGLSYTGFSSEQANPIQVVSLKDDFSDKKPEEVLWV